MNSTQILSSVLLIIFFALMIAVGFYTRRKATDVAGFVLGGRSVGPWLTAFAFGTSYFSAVIFVGYAGQFGWLYGMSATWAGLGNAFIGSLLAWNILGRRTPVLMLGISFGIFIIGDYLIFKNKNISSKVFKIMLFVLLGLFVFVVLAFGFNS